MKDNGKTIKKGPKQRAFLDIHLLSAPFADNGAQLRTILELNDNLRGGVPWPHTGNRALEHVLRRA